MCRCQVEIETMALCYMDFHTIDACQQSLLLTIPWVPGHCDKIYSQRGSDSFHRNQHVSLHMVIAYKYNILANVMYF